MDAAEAVMRETPKQKWRRRILKTLHRAILIGGVYLIIVLAARLLHRKVVYQPPSDPPLEIPAGSTALALTAKDGVPVHALHFIVPKAKRTIVHFHGNAETAEDNSALARELGKKGFDVVLVEYRGYGHARGASPNEEGLYFDALAVLDALAARGVGSDKIVLMGHSLGTGVAAEMAHRKRGARLILMAPYTSMLDLARVNMPVLPASLVMVDRFDTIGKAPGIDVPALVVHGDIDDVIPFEQGERVSRALPHATFIPVAEGRHEKLYKNVTVMTKIVAHAGS
jgi:alpha-beta hydrolase superfamily lysophospholipase